MKLFYQFLLGMMATITFSFYFRAPRHVIVKSAIVGGIGWCLFYSLKSVIQNPLVTILIASFVVSMGGEILARYLYIPATAVIYPAITPLVPGAGMYYTMYSLINKDYINFMSDASDTFLLAAGLALGILCSSVFSNLIFKPTHVNKWHKKDDAN